MLDHRDASWLFPQHCSALLLSLQSQALRNHVLVCRTLGSALPDVEGDEEGDDDQGGNNDSAESSGSRLFCVICREARRRGEGFKKLPCSHSFHFSCLQQWLTASSSIICPM